MKFIALLTTILIAGCTAPTVLQKNDIAESGDFTAAKNGDPFFYTEYFDYDGDKWKMFGLNYTITYTGDTPQSVVDPWSITLVDSADQTTAAYFWRVDGQCCTTFYPGWTKTLTLGFQSKNIGAAPYSVWFDDHEFTYTATPVESGWTHIA